MRALLPFLLLVPTAAFAQIGPPPTTSIDWTATAVETLSVEPPLYRVHFEIVNADPTVSVYEFQLRPYEGGSSSPEACAPQGCQAPDDWSCTNPLWYVGSFEPPDGVDPGETVGGFSFLTAGGSCCWLAEAMGPVLTVVARDALCIGDADAVQVREATWGRVKVLYR